MIQKCIAAEALDVALRPVSDGRTRRSACD